MESSGDRDVVSVSCPLCGADNGEVGVDQRGAGHFACSECGCMVVFAMRPEPVSQEDGVIRVIML